MDEMTNTEGTEKAIRNRNLVIGVGVIAAIAVVFLCILALLFVLIDPFNIISRLTGGDDPVANAMPADTLFYMGVDIDKLKTRESERIIDAFTQAAQSAGLEETGSLVEDIDDELEATLNLTYSEDILPWVGDHLGMGILNFDMDIYSDQIGEVILVVEVRDKDKADDFVEKLSRGITRELDEDVDQFEYRGTTIYEMQSAIESERFAFGRSDDLFILATSADLLKDAVDAAEGESLADTQLYDEVTSSLPKDRGISFLISTEIYHSFQETYDQLLPGFGDLQTQQLEAFRWMAGSISTTEEGIQLDYFYAYDEDLLDPQQLSMLESGSEYTDLAEFFPEETFFFVTGARLDLVWENLSDSLFQTPEFSDFEESMELFEQEFGFNPDTDFFPLLDGAYSLGVFETRRGPFAEDLDIPVGLLILIETSDDQELSDIVDKISIAIEEYGVADAYEYDTDDLHLYEFEDPYENLVVFVLGSGKGMLLLGTDLETLEETFTRENSLQNDDKYDQAFPGGAQPVFYFDLDRLYDILEDEFQFMDDTDALAGLELFRPMSSIAAYSGSYKDGVLQSTIVLFIEGE